MFSLLVSQAAAVQRSDRSMSPVMPSLLETSLMSDEQCYPGIARYFDSLDEALSLQPSSGRFEDSTFYGQDALIPQSLREDQATSSTYYDYLTMFYSWVRPFAFQRGNTYSLWGTNGIQPNGVMQGSLGDCWLLAAASALAEHPNRIEKIFANRGYQSDGFYVFEFFLLGEPKYVVIDDRLPIKNYRPYNAKRSENYAWWMPLLEKGFAKYTKTYYDLKGGNELNALRAMTGMPVSLHFSEDLTADEIWDLMSVADQKHYVMTASCSYEIDGLNDGHAYTVLGVNEQNKMVKLRNPWAREAYTGVGSDQTNDGLFEMPVENFKQAFGTFTILAYKDWKVTSLGHQEFPGGGYAPQKFFYEIRNPVAQETTITIDQVHEKFADGECEHYTGSSRIKLYSSGEERVGDAINASGDRQASNSLQFDSLEAGDYLLEIWAFNRDVPFDYNLQVYSEDEPIHFYEPGSDDPISTERSAEYVF